MWEGLKAHLERRDECVVCVEVCDNLEPAAETDDLTLDVLLEDPVVGGNQHHCQRPHKAYDTKSRVKVGHNNG